MGVADVVGGEDFVAIRFTNGTVMGSGDNAYEQLGLADSSTHFFEADLPAPVIHLACGRHSTLLLLETGAVLASGENAYGELGVISEEHVKTVPAVGAVARLAAGNNQSYLLLEDGSLFASGFNLYGSLGLGDTVDRHGFTPAPLSFPIAQMASGGLHLVVLGEEGEVASCGNNLSGELGIGRAGAHYRSTLTRVPTSGVVRRVVCYGAQTFLLFEGGRLEACGINDGQLGVGDQVNHFVLTPVPAAPVAQVATGLGHSAALLMDGTLMCCGSNYSGQLGTDDRNEVYELFTPVPM